MKATMVGKYLAFGQNFGAIEIRKLGLQFPDPRMPVEQGRRLLRQLRAQRHALFRKAADQFRIENFRGFDRFAGLKHPADQSRFRFRVGLQRTRIVQLGIDFTQLLVRQRSVVSTDEKAGFLPEFLHP